MTTLSPMTGRVIAITGAGAGLGREHALELARRGAGIVVADINADNAQAVVDEIRSAGGIAVSAVADVATPDGGESVVAAALEWRGRIDGLVNNAGFLRNGYFEDLTSEQIRSVIGVHLEAAFYVTQPAWKFMKGQGYGRIVMTSSGAGVFGYQGMSNYAAAKAGLIGLAKALAFEAGQANIKVNCVLPIADTSILDTQPVLDGAKFAAQYRPDGFEEFLLTNRRKPAITSRLIALLLSEECPINGEVYSSSLGRFSRVFTAETAGWVVPDVEAFTAEDLAASFDTVRNEDGYQVFASLHDETAFSMNALMGHDRRSS